MSMLDRQASRGSHSERGEKIPLLTSLSKYIIQSARSQATRAFFFFLFIWFYLLL